MKILHTADLHIGRTINGVSLLEQQQCCLNQIIDYLKENPIDYVIIAGDIYDRSVPSKEAVTIVSEFITNINKLNIPLITISGNHDSSERLAFLSQVLNYRNIYIVSDEIEIQKIEFGEIVFYCSPYFDYLRIAHYYEDDKIINSESALLKQLEKIELDKKRINIFVGHHFFANETSQISDSERPLQVGGMNYIPITPLLDFDYVALGHLHQAQKVTSEKIRYSGSIYKYSESEVNHHKSFTVIDIKKDKFEYQLINFKFEKDVKVKRGYFKDLIKENDLNYIYFHLLDENIIVDAMNQLLTSYPNALAIKYVSLVQNTNHFIVEKLEEQDSISLFKEYFELTHQKEIGEDQVSIIQNLLKENEL